MRPVPTSSTTSIQPIKVPPYHPLVSAPAMMPPLTSLTSPGLPSFPPNPGIIPPQHQALLNSLNPLRLDSTLLSSAQMNNYSVAAAQAAVMAANSLASLSQAALMPPASSFSPALLGQFLPPPVSSVYNIRTSRPAPSTSRPSSSGPTAS